MLIGVEFADTWPRACLVGLSRLQLTLLFV
jgi:hypothetical protein